MSFLLDGEMYDDFGGRIYTKMETEDNEIAHGIGWCNGIGYDMHISVWDEPNCTITFEVDGLIFDDMSEGLIVSRRLWERYGRTKTIIMLCHVRGTLRNGEAWHETFEISSYKQEFANETCRFTEDMFDKM
jgi:hypothetical protein